MRAEGNAVSVSQLCRWLGVPRSSFYYRGEAARPTLLDVALVEVIRRIIDGNPAYGLPLAVRVEDATMGLDFEGHHAMGFTLTPIGSGT